MSDYTLYSDTELSGLFREGDDAAFKEIYLRYNKLLYLFALRRLEDQDEAMDVVQDVFVWLLNNREKVALNTSLSAYLYKSVLNKVLDIFRHQQTIRKYIAQGDHFIEVDSQETDYLIREKDIAEMIAREIESMPPRMREVYKMRHQQHLDTEVIAETLGISENTVIVQLQRGTKHLRKHLGTVVFILYLLNQ
ncbi:MAG TPA: RNA polymerase sigma-70 factor [Mucilaginibacter sp.]|nr:RNA polymerase sigma-70 factor [Mucilaginibacter sp.]